MAGYPPPPPPPPQYATAPPPPPPAAAPPPPPPPASPMKTCLSCGQQIPIQYNVCPYCQKATSGKPAGEGMGGMKYVFYILSFLIWPLGILLGIILLISDDPEKKHVGKNCILIAVIMLILVCVLYFVVFAVWFAALSMV